MNLKATFFFAAVGLFSQAALADGYSNQPCGNYGISTAQQPCTPQQPVYSQPPAADPYAQPQVYVQPAPCQQPAPAPRAGYYTRPRYQQAYAQPSYQPQPTFGMRLQTRRAEMNTAPNTDRGFEVGVRAIQDSYNFEVGAGVFMRAHQQGGMQRLAIEVSADATDSALLGQGAVMAYLNPFGAVKPYGLVGGGLDLNQGGTVVQAGGGLDIDLGPRLMVTGDVRAIQGVDAPVAFLFGSVGLSRTF